MHLESHTKLRILLKIGMPSEPLIAFYNHLVFQVLDSAGNPQELHSTVALSFCSKKTTSDRQSLSPANVGMSLHIAFPPLDGKIGHVASGGH